MSERRASLALLLLAVVLYLPGLGAGLMADDHFFVFSLRDLPPTNPFHNLFGLVRDAGEVSVYRERGILPWWASDDMRIAFWRPLSSFTHWLDVRCFGDDARAMHAVSLGWYALTVALVHRVFARFAGAASRTTLLAVAAFALDDAHALNVQWIASRNDLIAATFTLLALLGFLRLREGGHRGNHALLHGGFVAALMAKESAIVLPALLLAHTLAIPDADGASATKRLSRNAIALGVVGAIAAVYLLGYFAAGHGPNTLFYLNPLRAPALWASQLLRAGFFHGVILAVNVPLTMFAGAPARELPLPTLACAAVLVGFVALAWRTLRHDRAAWFFGLWTLAGLALVTTSFPDPRLLFVPSIGFAFVLGRLLDALWSQRRAVGVGLAVLHLALAPLVTEGCLHVVDGMQARNAAVTDALRAQVDYAHLPREGVEVFFLNWHQRESSPLATLRLVRALPGGADLRPLLRAPGASYLTRVDRAFAAMRVGYHPLSFLPADVEVEVRGARELVLRPRGGDFFPTVFERLYRTGTAGLRAGRSVSLRAFTATLDEVDASGRVRAVRFTFPRALSSRGYRFMAWDGARWRSLDLGTSLAARPLSRVPSRAPVAQTAGVGVVAPTSG